MIRFLLIVGCSWLIGCVWIMFVAWITEDED